MKTSPDKTEPKSHEYEDGWLDAYGRRERHIGTYLGLRDASRVDDEDYQQGYADGRKARIVGDKRLRKMGFKA